MSENPLTSSHHHVRRRHYVDRNIQGRLIVALILIEMLLFAAAMWFVYQQMQAAIDQELYRVHQVAARSSPVLLHALYQVMPWIIIVNVLVTIGIDRIWASHINLIVGKLRRLAQQVASLDLRGRVDAPEHAVLRQASQWLEAEQLRCQQIRQWVQTLPDKPDLSDPAQQQRLVAQLQRIQQYLD
jgi:hypothetical protein